MRHVVLCLLLMFSIPTFANEADRLTQANFPAQSQQLALKNQAVLTYLWADVYAAALYAPADLGAKQAWDQQKTLRLVLYYFRDIDRSDVIKAATGTPKAKASCKGPLWALPKMSQNLLSGPPS